MTAGNASGIVDGGAALILASRELVDRTASRRSAVSIEWAAVGVDPAFMGMGPGARDAGGAQPARV